MATRRPKRPTTKQGADLPAEFRGGVDEADTDLRDSEQVPLMENGGIEAFIRREVLPFAPDAWIDKSSVKIGYEIAFNRYFYQLPRLRDLQAVRQDILTVEERTRGLLQALVGEVQT